MLKLELIEYQGDSIVQANISHVDELLTLSYSTQVAFETDWPDFLALKREDELWRHTCLECFIADPANTAYLEVNLSPSGAWNAYQFDRYREGRRNATGVSLHSMTSQRGRLTANLSHILPGSAALSIGLTAVLADTSGKLHYFALSHGDEPDFHHRDRHVFVRRDEL